MSKTYEEREVTPQFGGAGNLGTFTIKPRAWDVEALKEAVGGDLTAKGLCHMLNGQANITFPNRVVYGHVRRVLEAEHGKPEAKKQGEWHARHLDQAREIAKEFVEGYEFDFVELTLNWIQNDFAKRGTSQAKLPVLAGYDAVEAFIKGRWATAKAEAKAMCISQCKLTGVSGESTSEEVLVQLAKQYQRPVAVDMAFLDEEEE